MKITSKLVTPLPAPPAAPVLVFNLEVSAEELQQIERGLYMDNEDVDETGKDNYAVWTVINDAVVDNGLERLRVA